MIGRQWRQKFKSWTNQILSSFAPPTTTLLGDLPCLSNFLSAWLHPVKNVTSTVLVLLTILGMITDCQPPPAPRFLNKDDLVETEALLFRKEQLFLYAHIKPVYSFLCSLCQLIKQCFRWEKMFSAGKSVSQTANTFYWNYLDLKQLNTVNQPPTDWGALSNMHRCIFKNNLQHEKHPEMLW